MLSPGNGIPRKMHGRMHKMGKHAHAQIEYTKNGDQVESLVGFNPTAQEDRKFVHELLDEFLDYIEDRFRNGQDGVKAKTNHFEVGDLIHE